MQWCIIKKQNLVVEKNYLKNEEGVKIAQKKGSDFIKKGRLKKKNRVQGTFLIFSYYGPLILIQHEHVFWLSNKFTQTLKFTFFINF